MAIRRGALERVGPFDVSLEHGGDEQEWQERLRADTPARESSTWVARRSSTAAPARTRACARSRAPPPRAVAPPGASTHAGGERRRSQELLTLAGCLGHVVRRRCPAGLTMVAHSWGRVREGMHEHTAASDQRGSPPDDFLSGTSGTVGGLDAVRRETLDSAIDAWELLSAKRLRLGLAARHAPPLQRVLALGVERPERRELAAAIKAELLRSRHDVELHTRPADARGKFENLNLLLAAQGGRALDAHDWLLVIDDDVELPRGFLDRFLFLCERFSLALAQPAHRLHSHAAWPVTRRRARSVVRETRFVEIGPVTAFASRTFGPAAVPRAAHGLGPGRPLGGAGARARLALRRASTPSRSAIARHPRPRPTRARTRSPRRARSSPSARI